MESPIDPVTLIQDEPNHLTPHLTRLERAAAAMATAVEDDLRGQLATFTGFLRDHLLEHAHSEERDLYSVVKRLLCSLGGATATMSRDHKAIAAVEA